MSGFYFFLFFYLAFGSINCSHATATSKIEDLWQPDFTGFDPDPSKWPSTLKTKLLITIVTAGALYSITNKLGVVVASAAFVYGAVNITWSLAAAVVLAAGGYAKGNRVWLFGGCYWLYCLLLGVHPLQLLKT